MGASAQWPPTGGDVVADGGQTWKYQGREIEGIEVTIDVEVGKQGIADHIGPGSQSPRHELPSQATNGSRRRYCHDEASCYHSGGVAGDETARGRLAYRSDSSDVRVPSDHRGSKTRGPRRIAHDFYEGPTAVAISCQPQRESLRFSWNARSKKRNARRAAPDRFPAVSACSRSRMRARLRAITVSRYRLKNGNPACCMEMSRSPASARTLRKLAGSKCWRCPICRSKADRGPPGTVMTTRQRGFRYGNALRRSSLGSSTCSRTSEHTATSAQASSDGSGSREASRSR